MNSIIKKIMFWFSWTTIVAFTLSCNQNNSKEIACGNWVCNEIIPNNAINWIDLVDTNVHIQLFYTNILFQEGCEFDFLEDYKFEFRNDTNSLKGNWVIKKDSLFLEYNGIKEIYGFSDIKNDSLLLTFNKYVRVKGYHDTSLISIGTFDNLLIKLKKN